MRKLTLTCVLGGLLLFSGTVLAQGNNPLITVDENGNGSLLFPGGTPIPTTGVLTTDPGPGGLGSALSFNLLGPPGLVAGDLVLFEPGTASAVISDIIRFNPAGTGSAGYPASLVFYSDNLDGADALADTGFPTANYTNVLFNTEVGAEGSNGFLYTPSAGQPGFVAGFNVTYNIISDSAPGVPEPASAALVLLGGSAVLVGRHWRKKRAV